MVLLALGQSAKATVQELQRVFSSEDLTSISEEDGPLLERLSRLDEDGVIDHRDLIQVSRFSNRRKNKNRPITDAAQLRLDALLKGAIVFRPLPPAKPEPSPEYKALMERLRRQEEQRQYDRMLNPSPPSETFQQRFPNSAYSSATMMDRASIPDEVDEVTYADVNRQMALIINILVSILACSVGIWIAARRWDVPSRLGLSMSGSGIIAVAEVVIYMGYIKRIKDAKTKEVKKPESKEIVKTWVLKGSSRNAAAAASDHNMRFRKGKHR